MKFVPILIMVFALLCGATTTQAQVQYSDADTTIIRSFTAAFAALTARLDQMESGGSSPDSSLTRQVAELDRRLTGLTRRANNTDQLLMEAGGATPEIIAGYRNNPKGKREDFMTYARAGIRNIVVADPLAMERALQEGSNVQAASGDQTVLTDGQVVQIR